MKQLSSRKLLNLSFKQVLHVNCPKKYQNMLKLDLPCYPFIFWQGSCPCCPIIFRGLMQGWKSVFWAGVTVSWKSQRSKKWFSESTKNLRESHRFDNLICHKYKESTRVKKYWQVVDTLSKTCLIHWDLLLSLDVLSSSKIWRYSKTCFGVLCWTCSETPSVFWGNSQKLRNRNKQNVGVWWCPEFGFFGFPESWDMER